MSLVTPASLLASVRDYADQPDDGDGATAYVSDTQIYGRLTKSWRKLVRKLARNGVFVDRLTRSFSPAATITFTDAEVATYLSVTQELNNTRTRIRRLNDGEDPLYSSSSTYTSYWQPHYSTSALPSINLFPTPTAGTIRVIFVPEPGVISSGSSSLYLPASWEDVIVLEAAMRCYAKEDGSNEWLAGLYREAVEEAEYDAVQRSASDAAVVRNVDATYAPGDDQSPLILDPADFWSSPA